MWKSFSIWISRFRDYKIFEDQGLHLLASEFRYRPRISINKWDVIIHPNLIIRPNLNVNITAEFYGCMHNYIALCVDVISYLCPKSNAGPVILCYKTGSRSYNTYVLKGSHLSLMETEMRQRKPCFWTVQLNGRYHFVPVWHVFLKTR